MNRLLSTPGKQQGNCKTEQQVLHGDSGLNVQADTFARLIHENKRLHPVLLQTLMGAFLIEVDPGFGDTRRVKRTTSLFFLSASARLTTMLDHLLNHPVGLIHVLIALVALGFGTAVVLRPKGTARHRLLGRGYLSAMIGLNASALMIYEVFGGFGPFHWLALVSLASVLGGYHAAWSRYNNWRHSHAYFMVGSYIGLLAATAAEIASRVPGWSFGTSVIASSSIVIAVGCALMWIYVPRALGR